MTKRGGQAFPRAGDRQEFAVDGMTLRDYFAGRYASALIADASLPDVDDHEWAKQVAQQSYALADAMLAEREKQ